MRLDFDIETNGLLPDVDTLHSLVITDLDSGDVWSASSQDRHDLTLAVKEVVKSDLKVGHNILSYDIPVLKHLFPEFDTLWRGTARDTFIMAKMIWPVDKLKELDFPRWRKGSLPGQLIGAHKLEAWGYRLGRQKGEYSKDVKDASKEYAEHGDLTLVREDFRCLATVDDKGKPALNPWLAWNQPMQDYCVTDVEVTTELFNLIEGHLDGSAKAAQGIGWSPESMELEHRVWQHIEKQTERGYGFDKESAIKLAGELKTRQRELEDILVEEFGSWWQPLDDPEKGTTPAKDYSTKMTEFPDVEVKRFSEKTGKELKPYVGPPLCHFAQNAPFVRIKWTTFNAKSRQHLGERLQAVHGWKPSEFGGKDGNQAKVDETTIKAIPKEVLNDDLREIILEYLVVSKTLGQLADGKKSWIDLCAEDGRLHGRMDTLGTVSHRGAHYTPNLAQVPSVRKDKDDEPILGWKGGFGVECRRLFRPGTKGWDQTGIDTSGLELRLLGHYLEPYDGGEFAARVSSPGLDIHAENGKITGLSRADTKTVTYAFLYGAGPLKIGLGVGVPDDQIEELANSPQAANYVGWMKKTFRRDFIMPDINTLAHVVRGQQVSRAFLDGISGLKDLKKDITEEAKRGFIVAIDGRKLSIRKPHAAINQLLQGGGAVVCKMWILLTEEFLLEDGLIEDQHYGSMAWVHDEDQYEHEKGLHERITEASEKAIKEVSKRLSFRGELAIDSKLGGNWMECH